MELLAHISEALYALPAKRFWLMWIALVVAGVTYVLTVVRPATTHGMANRATGPSVWGQTRASDFIMATGLLTVFLIFYIALILKWEDFAYYDNSILTAAILKNRAVGPPIWPQNGRFFPFGLLEFNLVALLTNSPVGYQLLPVGELLIFSCILLTLDSALSIVTRATLAIVCLLTPSILISFGGLIYTERNVLFFLSCLMLSLLCFEETGSTAWAIVAVLSAQIMIYYKETVFLLLLAFAGSRLLLRCRKTEGSGWNVGRLWDSESRLDWCLVGLAVAFLLSYLMMMGWHANLNYAHQASHPLKAVLLANLGLDLLIWIFGAIVLVRIYLIVRRRILPQIFWDGLALGGIAYLAAYQSLRMFNSYYLAPVDLIAVLYVGRIMVLSWSRAPMWGKVVTVMLACAVMVQNVALSGMAIFERKNTIHAKTEIASVILGLSRSWPSNRLRLFFPFGSPYVVMEFASYLNYRGVSPDTVTLVTATSAHDGLCVNYRSVKCYAGRTPAPGDLVIVLPEDEASLAEASVYRVRGKLLFFYKPRFSMPRGLYSEIGGVPLSADKSLDKLRPDRWMDASVTAWR